MKAPKAGEEAGADFNVRVVHGQIWREHAEPTERFRAMPAWLKYGIFGPMFLWALWYVFVFSGGFRSAEYYEGFDPVPYHMAEASAPDAPPASSADDPETRRKKGELVYTSICSSCHQTTGLGLAGAFPPLAGSDWVKKDPAILAGLVLHGLSGPINVNGVTYNGAMPPFGASLSDRDIANVLSYIRSAWGNDSAPVDAPAVASVRKAHAGRGPWTAEEIKQTYPD